ncbi:MAG: hypothetical protein R3F59_32375 [Myxococcota bacterium]
MRPSLQRALTVAVLAGFAAWGYGNLYEAVVFSPNWVVDAGAQMARLDAFFVRTSPTAYFVPPAFLAPPVLWALAWRNEVPSARRPYRLASFAAVAAVALNLAIVAVIIPRLFGPHRASDGEIGAFCWLWNGANGLRVLAVSATVWQVLGALRALEGAWTSRSSWTG